jgi:hypothetical protein
LFESKFLHFFLKGFLVGNLRFHSSLFYSSSTFFFTISQRIASVDLGLSIKYLIQTFDYEYPSDKQRFMNAIEDLFKWFHSGWATFIAPYFPLIQSSGTGKTKLLYEAQEYYVNNETHLRTTVHLLFCVPPEGEMDNLIKGMEQFIVKDFSDVEHARQLRSMLNKFVHQSKNDRIILFFDEAQHLIKYDALPFRIIRWWLRAMRGPKQVVAVFAGTNSKLANFIDYPLEKPSRDVSTQYYNQNIRNVYLKFYPPFYHLNTTGIYANCKVQDFRHIDDFSDDDELARKMALYGRPLFAHLDHSEQIHSLILMRMMCGGAWTDLAFLSILGTRFQLDPSQFSVASKLVAQSYAVLAHYQAEGKRIWLTYPPEPVCSVLAAAVMSDKFDSFGIQGRSKVSFVVALNRLCENGLANIDRGDLGEMASAIFCLFCADEVRERTVSPTKIKAINYSFSYSLSSWLLALISIPSASSSSTSSSSSSCSIPSLSSSSTSFSSSSTSTSSSSSVPVARKSERLNPSKPSLSPKSSSSNHPELSMSALQFCRCHLKTHLSWYFSEDFLKWCYAARIGIYLPHFFRSFDLLIPIRCVDQSSTKFFPILVSVKTMSKFSKAHSFLKTMEEETNLLGNPLCLCLLFWVGLCEGVCPSTQLKQKCLTVCDIDSFIQNPMTMHKLVIFPENDIYGIQHLIECTSQFPDNVKKFLSSPFYPSLTPGQPRSFS